MSNLTITIEEETLKKARIRALTEGTSVNEVLRKFLEAYAGVSSEQRAALRDLIELSHQAKSRRSGKRWSRDELYERK
jgi:plasmid stability protein